MHKNTLLFQPNLKQLCAFKTLNQVVCLNIWTASNKDILLPSSRCSASCPVLHSGEDVALSLFAFVFFSSFQHIISVLSSSYLYLICSKCSWTVILAYPPPPGIPCRNNEQFCCNIVLLRVKIPSLVKQRENQVRSQLRIKMMRWLEGKQYEQCCVCMFVSYVVYFGPDCVKRENMISLLSPHYLCRKFPGRGCVSFGGQDMRW